MGVLYKSYLLDLVKQLECLDISYISPINGLAID